MNFIKTTLQIQNKNYSRNYKPNFKAFININNCLVKVFSILKLPVYIEL